MNKKTLSVSIGIPAYNEEGNIKNLLLSILSQKEEGFYLKYIIVVSDGSNDKTVQQVKEIKNKRIRLVINQKRLGKALSLNKIFSLFSGDIIILVDADIYIKNKKLVSIICKNFNIQKNGILSMKTVPLSARNFFERCINYSVEIRNELLIKWNNGDNYLSYRGSLLCMSGMLTKLLKLRPLLVNDDAYLYFYTKLKGYSPKYLEDEDIFYRSPSNFKDYLYQTKRFVHSKYELSQLLPKEILNFEIPLQIVIPITIKFFIKQPMLFLSYLLIKIIATLLTMTIFKLDYYKEREVSGSTKQI